MVRLSLLLTLLAVAPAQVLAAPAPEPMQNTTQRPFAGPDVAVSSLIPDKPARSPYLSEGQAPDTVAILRAPPREQSATQASDKATFVVTRTLKGTPRWALATTDVSDSASAILNNFACIIGQRIDQSRVPALMTLLERARLDIAQATQAPKLHYRRPRPFVGNDAEICVMRTAELGNAFSFPSSHATQAWTYAAIMAALMPEKATRFFVRARSYGESRVVCGLHWASDIEAGRTTASAVFAALQGDPGFRADLEKARAELGKLVSTGGSVPDQGICMRESEGAHKFVL